MGSVALQVTLGGVVLLAGALVAATVLARAAARRHELLGAELRASRAQVEALTRRLEDLADEVADSRADRVRDPEYVITSLRARRDDVRSRPVAGEAPEDRLMGLLSRRAASAGPGLRSRPGPSAGPLVDTLVRAVSVGHGVRRALSADNLDRAAAEARLARRRSRRRRRQEHRDVRRLIRTAGSPR